MTGRSVPASARAMGAAALAQLSLDFFVYLENAVKFGGGGRKEMKQESRIFQT
jgi:hypothetical protein